MSATKTERDLVPVHLVAYEDDADLDVETSGGDAVVQNHDELVNNGQTYDEVRALSREDADEYNLNIVRPGDPLWDDRFHELEPGDAWRVEDL